MSGRTLNWFWKAMWAGVSPLLIISLFVFYLSDYILTGTLQYQAWDASQVPPSRAPRAHSQAPDLSFLKPKITSAVCAGYLSHGEASPGYLKAAQESGPGR